MFQPLRPLSGAMVLSLEFFTMTTSPIIELSKNQARRGAAVAAAACVAQAHAAVAGVVVAEGGLAAPVVAVDEGARVGQAHGVRHVLDVVLARRKPTVAPFIRVTWSFSLMTIWPLYVVVPGLPEVIGMVLIDLAVADDGHRVGLGVDRADLAAADGEGDRLGLLAVDTGRGPRRRRGRASSGDLGAGLPVLLGAEVEAVVAEPVALDRRPRLGVTLMAFSTASLSVMPRVKWTETGMPTPTVGAVLGGEVADEGVLRGRAW